MKLLDRINPYKRAPLRKIKSLVLYYVLCMFLIYGIQYGLRRTFFFSSYKDKTLFAGDCESMLLAELNPEKFDFAGYFNANEGLTLLSLQKRRYLPYKTVVFMPSTMNKIKNPGAYSGTKYNLTVRLKLKSYFPYTPNIVIPPAELLQEAQRKFPHPKEPNAHMSKEGLTWLIQQEPFEKTGILQDINTNFSAE